MMGQGLSITSENKMLYVNRIAEEVTGISVNEMMKNGRNVWLEKIVHPDDKERQNNYLINKNWPENDRYRAIVADGSVQWIEVHRTKSEYMGKECITAVARNITGRVELEHARESLLHALNEARDVFILFSYSAVGVRKFYSEGIEKMTGYPAEKFYIDENIKIRKLAHPDDVNSLFEFARIREFLDKKKTIPKSMKFRLKHKNGSYKFVESCLFHFEKNETLHIGTIIRELEEPRESICQKERIRIAEKLKKENVSEGIILKTTGVDLSNI
jgi:PAS domain S-box-containing protein